MCVCVCVCGLYLRLLPHTSLGGSCLWMISVSISISSLLDGSCHREYHDCLVTISRLNHSREMIFRQKLGKLKFHIEAIATVL